jgi:hypothetical protein
MWTVLMHSLGSIASRVPGAAHVLHVNAVHPLQLLLQDKQPGMEVDMVGQPARIDTFTQLWLRCGNLSVHPCTVAIYLFIP